MQENYKVNYRFLIKSIKKIKMTYQYFLDVDL